MAANTPLTAERLRKLLRYDPETGMFTRLISRGCSAAGAALGYIDRAGYRIVHVDGSKYRAARLAWLYMTGAWPANFIDHINSTPGDDRFANLRDVTPSVNAQNKRAAQSNSSTGLLGVARENRYGGFRAVIKINRKQIHIGTFRTAERAQAAYIAAKRRLHPGCTL